MWSDEFLLYFPFWSTNGQLNSTINAHHVVATRLAQNLWATKKIQSFKVSNCIIDWWVGVNHVPAASNWLGYPTHNHYNQPNLGKHTQPPNQVLSIFIPPVHVAYNITKPHALTLMWNKKRCRVPWDLATTLKSKPLCLENHSMFIPGPWRHCSHA